MKKQGRRGDLGRKLSQRVGNNEEEGLRDQGDGLKIQVSWMRVADINLRYAEAVANAYGKPSGKASGF